jgi:hypothetical protein
MKTPPNTTLEPAAIPSRAGSLLQSVACMLSGRGSALRR